MKMFNRLCYYDKKRKSAFVPRKKREVYQALYEMTCIEIETHFGWYFLHGFLLGKDYR